MSLDLEVKEEALLTGESKAVCSHVYDLGIQVSTFNGKDIEQHKIMIMFELEKRSKETNRRFLVSKEYTLSSSKRSNLMKDLESWRGKPYAVGDKIDVTKLIGINANLTISENDKGFPLIDKILPPTGETLKAEVKSDFMPDWVWKKIQQGKFENQNHLNPWAEEQKNDDKPPF